MNEWEFDEEACCRDMAEEMEFEFNRMMQERKEEMNYGL
jgi:hypothetical protein